MAGPWIIGKYAYSALVRDDMTADELKKGEHETVEFKQDISKDKDKYTKTAVAFANAAGGKNYIRSRGFQLGSGWFLR